MGSFLAMRSHERPRARSPDADSVAEDVRAFYERPSLSAAGRRPREVSTPGKTRRSAVRNIICFGPSSPFGRIIRFSSPAAGHLRRPSMPCAGPAARSPASISAQPACAAPRSSNGRYNLDNLQVHQLPIERARELGTSFDQIVCTGVLHHLADPDAGLTALRDVLEPGGAMHLMVYAPYGRTGIYMLQEFCRRIGIKRHRRRDPRSRRRAQRVAARPSVATICCATRRTSATRRRSPTRCCTRRIAPIRFRSCSISSKRRTDVRPVGEAGTLHASLRVVPTIPRLPGWHNFRSPSSTLSSNYFADRWFGTA